MTKMSLFKKFIFGALAIVALTFVATPAISASTPRDYNSNSIIYGGAYSVEELKGLLNTGVNRDNCKADYSCPYQTAADLKLLYGRLGMGPEHWANLQSGYVYKDGHVEVNGKTVKTNVQSMGRHYMPGSVREPLITYTNVYWRSPSVSFNSDRLPAFVKINYDNTMAFAIIKSCGNPVKGVGIRIRPTYSLTINKFNDNNSNKSKDANEAMLQGWRFTVNGPGVKNVVYTTGSNGSVTVPKLTDGTYTVTETQVNGWTSTTGLTRTVVIKGKNNVVWFGNRRIPVTPSAKYSIIARKYEDADADAKKDGDEQYIEGWKITLTGTIGGTAIKQEYLTDADGEVTFTDLDAGTYTITEETRADWKNITPLSQTVTVPSQTGGDPVVEFGNQKVKKVVPHGTPETPQPLPVSGPVDAIAGTFGIIGLGGAGSYYLKVKKALLSAIKKVK